MGRPAIGPDGSIHVAANDATLYAIKPDGTPKWTFNLTDNNDYAPSIDPNDGTVYSDIFGNALVAEILVRVGGGGEEKVGDRIGHQPVDFLWHTAPATWPHRITMFAVSRTVRQVLSRCTSSPRTELFSIRKRCKVSC